MQTSKQRGKNFAVDRGTPSHSTTGTMVNPALPVHAPAAAVMLAIPLCVYDGPFGRGRSLCSEISHEKGQPLYPPFWRGQSAG